MQHCSSEYKNDLLSIPPFRIILTFKYVMYTVIILGGTLKGVGHSTYGSHSRSHIKLP